MLPPFIIEQIRQREEKERARDEDARRPRVELPIPGLERIPAKRRSNGDFEDYEEDEPNRGVIVVDLL